MKNELSICSYALKTFPARGLKFFVWLIAISMLSVSPVEAQQRKAGDLVVKPYVFENSRGGKVDAELGVLVVPEKRGDPQANLIEVAFVRFKSTAKVPGPPIVYLAGGPGGSGIQTARGSRFPLFMALREIGDVIAFDERGIGMSKPSIGCWDLLLGIPLDVTPSRQVLHDAYVSKSRDCAEYWRDTQRVDLGAYNTNENADDLEDLRKAIGARRMTLWGTSYGTHLAFAALRRHPTSISRIMLLGTEGPNSTYKSPNSIQRHLEDLSAVIRADNTLGKRIPDFIGLMKSVFDKLDRKPAVVEIIDPRTKRPVKVPVNSFVFKQIVANNIGTTVTKEFPALFYLASQGDYESAAYAWLNWTREPLGSAMSYAMDCASGMTAARRERIKKEAPLTLLGSIMNDPFPEVCEAWNVPDLGDEFRSPVKSDLPVLFISGTLDARTPIAGADEDREGLPNSQHVILEGAVHGDPLFLSSPKIKDVMLEFLKGQPLSTTHIIVPMKFTPLP